MKKSIGQSHSIGTAPRLLTIKQVADRITVSAGCLRAWRIHGRNAHTWHRADDDHFAQCGESSAVCWAL
jgi:hypothetical protein